MTEVVVGITEVTVIMTGDGAEVVVTDVMTGMMVVVTEVTVVMTAVVVTVGTECWRCW